MDAVSAAHVAKDHFLDNDLASGSHLAKGGFDERRMSGTLFIIGVLQALLNSLLECFGGVPSRARSAVDLSELLADRLTPCSRCANGAYPPMRARSRKAVRCARQRFAGSVACCCRSVRPGSAARPAAAARCAHEALRETRPVVRDDADRGTSERRSPTARSRPQDKHT